MLKGSASLPPDSPESESRRPRPRRRALFAFAFLAAGLALGREVASVPPTLWLGLSALMSAAAILLRGWPCRALLAVGLVLLGAGWFALRINTVPDDSLLFRVQELAVTDRVPVALHGVILNNPLERTPPRDPLNFGRAAVPASTFDLDLTTAEGPRAPVSASGVVRVRVTGGGVTARAGDRVRIVGMLSTIAGPMNPGEPDARLPAAQDHRVGFLAVDSAALIESSNQPVGALGHLHDHWLAFVGRLRAGASAALDTSFDDHPWLASDSAPQDRSATAASGRALLSALIIGREDSALAPITAAYSRLGLVHVLSISGFHLAAMAALALFLVRLTGDRGWIEPLLVAALVILYLLIVPADAPIIRSGLMVLLFLTAEAAGRRYDRLNLLGWIACLLLLWRPMDLWAPGFQLSFGITGALLWLARPFHERLFPPPVVGRFSEASSDPSARGWKRTLRDWSTGLVSSCLLAWAVSTPLVLYHIGIVSPFAALSSIILIPVFTVLLFVGYIALALGAFIPLLAGIVGYVLTLLGDATAWLSFALDGLPGMAIGGPQVSLLWTAAATITLLFTFARGTLRDPRLLAALAIVTFWLAWIVATAGSLPDSTALRVDALAVGDGEAAIIRSADQSVLWGCSAPSPTVVRRTIPAAARALGAWRIRTLILPSTHLEGHSALVEAATVLGVTDVLISSAFDAMSRQNPLGPQGALLSSLRARGMTIRVITNSAALNFGNARLDLHEQGASLWAQLTPTAHASTNAPASPSIFLLGALKTAELDQAAGAITPIAPNSLPAQAVELPPHVSAAAMQPILDRTHPRVVWRSSQVRLSKPPAPLPADPARDEFLTARDGAVRVDISQSSEVKATSWLSP